MFKIPKNIINPMTLEAYVDDEHFDYYEKANSLIVNFESYEGRNIALRNHARYYWEFQA